MSKKSKSRSQEKRRKLKASKKAAKKAQYLANQGLKKGARQKKKDPNRYGKLWEKAVRSSGKIVL